MDNIIIEIKPLEWKEEHETEFVATTINGCEYRIWGQYNDNDEPDFSSCTAAYCTEDDSYPLCEGIDLDSFEIAKQVCQDDHVRMVMDVLNDFVTIKTKEQ